MPGSNWGSTYGQHGILAPGEDIPVAGPQGVLQRRTGTSYATAIVSGVAALLLSRERKRGRPIRPLLIRKALLAGGRTVGQTGSNRRLLAGRLNVTEAIHLLDTWSNTMTHEDLDLAAQCSSESNNGHDTHPVVVTPSSEPIAPQVQPSRAQAPPAPARDMRQQEYADAVQPSACAGCRGESELVYALGQLSYDLGSEAALDAFRQHMKANPLDPAQLHKFLDDKRKKKNRGTPRRALDAGGRRGAPLRHQARGTV